ncbi:hypothetical protein [Pseudohalocynthiibacter sp. F2068]|jgi:alginate O-acetyltransferase complex protein AlgI|uniref:SGNH/GDSL hydrolase family protein n=1 Tax=Pseudohalocynthiibacter sp. F2068 TaxID=2926418 RepID=UPI001FF410BC|nr:hypothetical protein [Pseudohalocynthiibacter sp. F2068]MCK0103941.1 hypothetical protein [Pseudohalocynthiibacter sp. F2068]
MANIEVDSTENFWELSGFRMSDKIAAIFALIGAFLCGTALSLDYFGGNSGMGTSEIVLLISGAGALGFAVLLLHVLRGEMREAVQFAAISAQIALLYLIIRTYDLENAAFSDFIFALVFSGFLANYFLHKKHRMVFFFGLSLLAMFGVFGLPHGMLLFALGVALILICHLPVSLWIRVVLLLAAGGLLVLARYGTIVSTNLNVILPIFGSIFMFRLIIYLYDITNGKGPKGVWARLSYFFMLPNFIFPFFPVVDFSSWGRNYYSGRELEIYQRGAVWIFLGCLHLIIYRFVNYYLVIDPVEVTSFAKYIHYILANFALYFKISGLFHTIIGCLHLFGFALPETHNKFYFSSSFIDLWQRINIYWKDFMQKLVFNPAYTRLKRAGIKHLPAAVTAIAVVFVCTWFLHAYQWFWLRGSIFFTVPDTLFWTMLGFLLICQTVLEAQPVKKDATALIGVATLRVTRTVATMLTFTTLWALWGSESMSEFYTLWAAAGFTLLDPTIPVSFVSVLQSALFIAFLGVIVAFAVGFTFGLAPPGSHKRASALGAHRKEYEFARHASIVVLVSAGLLAIQLPALYGAFPRATQLFVVDMRLEHLSALDQSKLERGYYENLTDESIINSDLWETNSQKPRNWQQIRQMEATTFTDDYLEYELLPNATTVYKGAALSTNSHGMRDQEYTLAAPDDVHRIAIAGASRAMGAGVADNETFESRLERQINANNQTTVEVLNFAIADYEPARRLLSLERKIWPFAPDVVFYIAHKNDSDVRHLVDKFLAETPLPYAFLEDTIKKAGVTPEMEKSDISRRLLPLGSEIAGEIYREFAGNVRNHGALPVWVYLPSTTPYSGPDETARILREMAQEAGFIILDLEDMYEGQDVSPLWIASWDQHPNARGHQIIADEIYNRMLTLPEVQEKLRLSQF